MSEKFEPGRALFEAIINPEINMRFEYLHDKSPYILEEGEIVRRVFAELDKRIQSQYVTERNYPREMETIMAEYKETK